jgi:hypothetical protein
MANSKISALTSATTPLAGTETLPIVQSSTTKKVAVSDLTAGRSISATSLGLGVASPATVLDVQAASAAVRVTSTTGTNQVFTRYGNTGGFLYTGIDTSAGGFLTGVAYSPFIWSSVNSAMLLATNNNECLRLETNADVKVSTGNLVIGTSGKGIDFSATPGTGTSELFADYEEGTFTPTMTIGGTAVVSYYAQAGLYTKVGNVVNFYVRISGNNLGAGAGNIAILGLPFTTNSTLSTTVYSLNDQAYTNAYAYIAASSTTISTGYTNATYLSGYALVFSGSYRV